MAGLVLSNVRSAMIRPDPEPDPSGPCDAFDVYLFGQDGNLIQSWSDVDGRFVGVSPDDRGFLTRSRRSNDSKRPAIERA